MAIALRGTAQTGSANNGGDVTLTFDAVTPPLEGDYVIVFGGHGSAVTTLTAPSGYTQIGIHTGSDPIFGAWYKKMGATPDTSVVCSGGGNNADGAAYCCWVLSGVDGTTPIDVTTTTAGPTTSTNPNSPSITPTTSGAWVLAMAGSAVFDGTPGTVSGYSNQLTATRNETNDLTTAGATFAWTSGAENPAAWDTWASGTWYALTVALRPASGGSDTEIIPPAAQLELSSTAPVLACGGNAAVRFDGDTDGINCGDVHDFASNAPFTIEFRTNIDATQPGGGFVRLVSKESSGGADGWSVELDVAGTNIKTFRKSSSTNDNCVDSYTAATNFHYAGVYDGTDLQGFIDGVGGTKSASSRSLPGNTTPLRFGRPLTGSNEFAGVLDEIRIWNYARTSAEINRDKGIRLQGSEEGLVGYWRLDTGSGTTATDDGSGGNDGTFEGDPIWVWSMPTLTGDGIEIPAANLQLSTTVPTISIDAVGGDVSIEIPAGNLQLSSTSMSLGIGISPPAAQLTISTTAATRTINTIRIPPAAQLQISTSAQILTQGTVRSPPAAQLELSSTAPSISVPVGIEIPAANLQFSTTAPTVTFGFNLEIPAAQLELSTAAPSILTPVGIEIPAGQLELSATAPSVLVPIGITIPAANLEFSTTLPFLNFGFAIEIPAAQLQFSSTAPSILTPIGITVPAANIQFSSTAPLLSQGLVRLPPAAQLELSTTAPSISIDPVTSDTEIVIPAANLQLSTAALSIDLEIKPAAAQLAFNATAPLLVQNYIRQPAAAQLTLSSFVPSILTPVGIEIPAAQLELSTSIPNILTPIEITIPAANLQLSTTASLIDFGIKIPAANLQFSTAIPIVLAPINIEIPAANLQFSTTIPSVEVGGVGDVSIEIPAGQLELSTTTPVVLTNSILDELIATPLVALSVSRRLLSSHTGALVRLERDSDSAESDFGYDENGDLDTAAITTWLGGANGSVVTIYDQSGNNYDVTQSTTANQPAYVASDSNLNNRPVADADGSTDYLEHTILPKANVINDLSWTSVFRTKAGWIDGNCVSAIEGSGNPAVRFDGVNDGINCGDVHDFTGTAPFTIEFWTNIDASQPGGSFVRLISKEKGSSLADGWSVELDVAGGNIKTFRKSNDTNDAAADSYSAGTDFHYAGVYDGTDLQGFIDGIGGTKVASSRSLPGNINPLKFGKPSQFGSNEFAGVLDEIRIWDYARTSAEINRDKDIRLSGDEAGLVGYWRLDEGTGTIVTDDGSGGNDGTFEGDPVWVGDETEEQNAVLFIALKGTVNNIDLRYLHEYDALGVNEDNQFDTNLTDGVGYVTHIIKDNTANTVDCYINNIAETQYNFTNDATNTSTNLSHTIGSRSTGANPTPVVFAEEIIFDSAISSTDRDTLANDQKIYYGINVAIEIPAAQLEISTTAPTILTPINVEVPAANLQLTTSIPSVSSISSFTGVIPAAQLELSTFAPLLNFGISIEIPAAQLQVTTTTPAISFGPIIEIPAAQLELSSTASTVSGIFTHEEAIIIAITPTDSCVDSGRFTTIWTPVPTTGTPIWTPVPTE